MGGVHISWVRLEDYSKYLFYAGDVLDQPLESVQLPWVLRTKDLIHRIVGHHLSAAWSTGVLPLPDCQAPMSQPARQALMLLPVHRASTLQPDLPSTHVSAGSPRWDAGCRPKRGGTLTSSPALPSPWRLRAPGCPASLLPSIMHTCLPSSPASALLDSLITCSFPPLYLSVPQLCFTLLHCIIFVFSFSLLTLFLSFHVRVYASPLHRHVTQGQRLDKGKHNDINADTENKQRIWFGKVVFLVVLLVSYHHSDNQKFFPAIYNNTKNSGLMFEITCKKTKCCKVA
jgi:hypothetical protein